MCNLCECEDSYQYMDRPVARKLLFLLTAQLGIALIDFTSCFFKSQLQNLIFGGFLYGYSVIQTRISSPTSLGQHKCSDLCKRFTTRMLSKENSNFLQGKNVKHRGVTQHVKLFSESVI